MYYFHKKYSMFLENFRQKRSGRRCRGAPVAFLATVAVAR